MHKQRAALAHRVYAMKPIASLVLALVAAATQAAELTTTATPRGAALEMQAEFPTGPGPFPVVVLAPGQGYAMHLPVLEQTARQLLAQGIAVYRFNWAYTTARPTRGRPAADLSTELEDLRTVLERARADARSDASRMAVGGKSLGSIVAWRALAADPALRAGLFLTPVCSRQEREAPQPQSVADTNYPGLVAMVRPVSFISGDRDPLCAATVLYRFVAQTPGAARVAVVGGDHSFEARHLQGPAAASASARNLAAAALLSASFLAEVLADPGEPRSAPK